MYNFHQPFCSMFPTNVLCQKFWNFKFLLVFLFIDLTVGADETTAIYPGIWLVQIFVFSESSGNQCRKYIKRSSQTICPF